MSLRCLLRRRRFRHLSTASTSGAASSIPVLWTHPGAPSSTVQILSWGRGSSGQLGSSKEEMRFYPSAVASLLLPSSFRLSPSPGRLSSPPPDGSGDAVEVGISCGLFHSALIVDGRLWVWGKGDGGRLGLGDEVSAFAPTLNPNLDAVQSVALGGVHSTALTRAGEVFTWGYGGFGALGHSVYHRELLPRLVNGGWTGSISHLATGGAHTAAITNSGELYTWGRDEGDGRLGLGIGRGPGEAGSFSIPSKVNALPVSVVAVTCGGFFTVTLTSEGQLWSWGANSNFELGRGNNTTDWRPKPITSLKDVCVIQIASGGYHSLALTDQGEVFSWGYGGHGQLGHNSIQNEKVPLAIKALAEEHIVYIACGGSTSAAVSDKGKLFMWGNARDCQLGVPGLPDIHPLPTEVNFLMDDESLGGHHVISVAVGASHAMCLVSRQTAAS
ncbi:RCC1 domain-containing protein RUG3, mitochondrial isoform X1 [Typha latifolia]|uniref:RCC1 domain-containing protein RUG3, mitochondrial isoform X1 n=1 Tax=Typha latifolia TaxID=4733 RepID=UPI003C2C93AB